MAPPVLIAWDTSNTNILQPNAGLILSGWAPNQKPTSTNHNWMFQNIMQWITYIAGPVGTGPVVQNFSAQTSVTVTHNLNRPHTMTVFGSSNGYGVRVFEDTWTAGATADTITFGGSQSGSIVIW